jgi:hypothetical protein
MHQDAIFITRAEQLADNLLFAVVLPKNTENRTWILGPNIHGSLPPKARAILGVLSITTSLRERTAAVAAANLAGASSDEELVNALCLRKALPHDHVETKGGRRQTASYLSFKGRRGSVSSPLARIWTSRLSRSSSEHQRAPC